MPYFFLVAGFAGAAGFAGEAGFEGWLEAIFGAVLFMDI